MRRSSIRANHELDDRLVPAVGLEWSRPLNVIDGCRIFASVATGPGHIWRPWGGAKLEQMSRLEWSRPR